MRRPAFPSKPYRSSWPGCFSARWQAAWSASAPTLIGCLFSGYGYNPIFCVPPILYGVTAGLFQGYLVKKRTLPRLALSFLPAIVLGSILYQSASLTLIYAAPDARAAFFLLKLATRGIQFSITWVIDVLLVQLLFQCKLFDRAGLWPPKRAKAAAKAEKGTEAT